MLMVISALNTSNRVKNKQKKSLGGCINHYTYPSWALVNELTCNIDQYHRRDVCTFDWFKVYPRAKHKYSISQQSFHIWLFSGYHGH